MHHRVEALEVVGAGVADVAPDGGNRRRLERREATLVVERTVVAHDVVPGGEQHRHENRADVAVVTGDENSHRTHLSRATSECQPAQSGRESSRAGVARGTLASPPDPPAAARLSAIRSAVESPRGVQHEPFRGPNRLRPCCEQRVQHPLNGCIDVCCNLVHEADAKGFEGAESLAGEEVAARRPLPDPGEDERRDHGRDDPEADLREAEHGVLGGQCDVCGGHEPEGTAHSVAVNPADDGRLAAVD